MTIKNIKSGFRVTGICPFNADAITLPGEDQLEEFNPRTLATQTGLKYIPLYCSSPLKSRMVDPSCSDHSTVSDPDVSSVASDDSPANMLCCGSGGLSELLALPQAPSKLPTKFPKASGRALTLDEYLEKEKAKRAIEQQKEERKRAREEKKRKKDLAKKGG